MKRNIKRLAFDRDKPNNFEDGLQANLKRMLKERIEWMMPKRDDNLCV